MNRDRSFAVAAEYLKSDRLLVRRHRDFETWKRAFGLMASLQILAIPVGIAVVCASP